ncbi:MAG TPA: hypothetical protein DDX85_01380 [Nitrospiraceae bacterium]|nr:hypothetical protein [Nitrospiraceae bacterium]
MNRKIITASLVVILAIVFSMSVQAAEYKTPDQLVTEAKSAIKQVSPADLKKMLDNKENVIVLDVRDRDEYEKQSMPGAIQMSRGLVDLHIQELIPDKNAKIVVV